MHFNIEQRPMGSSHPCFIIAEAGVNHNGNIDLAKELIRKAKEIGADCVKFQTFKAERIITESAPKAAYQLLTTDPQESQMNMLRNLELDFDAHKELITLCNDLDIVFMSTPYSIEDIDFLDEIGVPAFKLASIHIAEPSLLRYAATKGKPLVVSTGMASLAEVDTAVRTILSTGNDQFVLLQCTTNYPSRIEDTNLRAMVTMQKAFDVLIGYSDHTQTDTACIASIALGACVIEKHFTLDKSLPGPDQSTSYDAVEFARLVKSIREAEVTLGTGIKQPTVTEKANMQGMRRSIVAKQTLNPGDIITEDLVTFKRPATGLSPSMLDSIIGRRLRRQVASDQLIDFADLDDIDEGNR